MPTAALARARGRLDRRAARQEAAGHHHCSALKRAYRQIIIGDRPEVRLVYLRGGRDSSAEHLAGRDGHFMPASLLQSQIDTLEEPGPDEDPLMIDVGPPAEQIAEEIIRLLGASAEVANRRDAGATLGIGDEPPNDQSRTAAPGGGEGAPQPWRKWGPYVSERQWGTVREDYSADGDAWDYFPHEHARSRAYRWGEDGIAGLCDDKQRLCFALALWNGKDPILKERLFGLSNRQGNHGEDVKELYYYLDATPTHSYAQMLYKYPQAEFPYARLVEENARRAQASSPNSSSSIPASSTTTATSTSMSNMPRRRRRHPDADDGHQSRPRSGRDPCAAAALVSQYLELVRPTGSRRWSRSPEHPGPHPKLGEHIVHFERAGPDRLLRQRDQSRPSSTASRIRMASSRTASTNMW